MKSLKTNTRLLTRLSLTAILLIPVITHFASSTPVKASPGTIVAFDMVGSSSQNLISYTNPWNGAFSSAGDGFQKFQRGVSPSIPFSVLDDSLVIFPGDTLGIIKDGNTDVFFGVVDTENGDNIGPVTATWVFDISGTSGLSLSIDMGAMGDFESSDYFTWDYSIDGGPVQNAFSSTVDEAGSFKYTLEGGASFTLADPMLIQGTILSDDIQTFITPLNGSGDQLTLTLTARFNGGTEAVAFQNIVIIGGIGPTNQPPIADAGGPYTVDEGTTIALDASGSNDPDSDIVSYEWDLDNDGQYDDAVGETTTLVFNDNGSYTVGLKVTDSYGEYDTDTTTVTVNDLGPTAVLTGDIVLDEGQVGGYDASGSFSSPDTIVSFEWDWDYDGFTFNPYGDTGATQSHAWNDHGTYTVAVRVTDDDGSTDIATISAAINDLGPTAVLTGDILLDERQMGNYDASGSTSSPDAIVLYEWDWDYDGITFIPSGDVGATQSHVWNDDGTYTVAVRVTDDDGSSDITTLSVTVENPPPEIMVENLSNDIDETELPASTKNNLTTSLDTASKVLEDSNPKNDKASINTLQAFINKIEAQRGKKIPTEIADELIAKAQEIIAELSGET